MAFHVKTTNAGGQVVVDSVVDDMSKMNQEVLAMFTNGKGEECPLQMMTLHWADGEVTVWRAHPTEPVAGYDYEVAHCPICGGGAPTGHEACMETLKDDIYPPPREDV